MCRVSLPPSCFSWCLLCSSSGDTFGGPTLKSILDVNQEEVLCGLSEKGKKVVFEWFLTRPCLCCVADDETAWKMGDRQRKTEIGRGPEQRQPQNKTKMGDTEGEAETIRRMLSLHHYFNTHSPSTVTSSLFYYSRSLSSFLSIIHPLSSCLYH